MGNTPKIYQALMSRPWAIEKDSLALLIDIASRKEVDIAAVEERIGRKLENTRTVSERNGIAIIPVTGPIFRYANLFSEISGATSVQVLAQDFNAALNDPNVKGILFNIDSPGGDANGINEFAQMVYAARGRKPMYGYIGGMGCSAAYWIASALDAIYCDATALVGSIGVVASIPTGDDPTEVMFISSQSPRKRPDPQTEDGKSDIQEMVNAMAEVFIATVARNRGVSVDTVLSDFGQGGVFVGQKAVDAGLIDQLGSFEGTLASMGKRERMPMGEAKASTPVAIAASTATEIKRQLSRSVQQRVAIQQGAGMPIVSASLATPIAAGRTPQAIQDTRQPKEKRVMSEPLEDVRAAPPVETPPPDAPVMSEAERAAFIANERQRYLAEIEAIKTEARLEVQREIAKDRREQKLTAWAQDVCSASLDRPYAIPIEPQALAAFAIALDGFSPKLTEQFQGFATRILDAGLIDFREVGSQGGADERDAREQYQAAVSDYQKAHPTATRVEVLKAVNRLHPDLYEAQRTSKGGR